MAKTDVIYVAIVTILLYIKEGLVADGFGGNPLGQGIGPNPIGPTQQNQTSIPNQGANNVSSNFANSNYQTQVQPPVKDIQPLPPIAPAYHQTQYQIPYKDRARSDGDIPSFQKPKEETVEQVEKDLMVGSGVSQKKQGVVTGVVKDQESPAPTSLIDEESEAKSKADKFQLPYVNLNGFTIKPETLKIIPQEIAQKYNLVAYLLVGRQVKIASIDPKNRKMIDEVGDLLHEKSYAPLYAFCSRSSVQYGQKGYAFINSAPKESGDLKVGGGKTQFKKEIKSFVSLKNEINKVSTTKLFDVLISGAIKNNASDMHVEPSKNQMRIRYRIDGVLHDVVALPDEAYKSLVSRIKFLSKMKLDLKNLPQDGRFTITSEGKNIDLRVSTLPTVYGEGIVIRLLEEEKGFLSLEELGFSKATYSLVFEAIKKPNGMILNTGPTGSGKTTTLYAILDKLNKPGVKIITLEDPVEYRISGITQSQIDSYSHYSFANGLKHILRQDPDIIMVGEIRDLETARIALNAAMTGHLVLTTLHTNNATSAPARLLEMGVKPFLLTSNIDLILAQRLVRKLCPECKKRYVPRPGILEAIKQVVPGETIPKYLWKATGCKECRGTGYKGRIPVSEAFSPTPEFEEMFLEQISSEKIRERAIKGGMETMQKDGINKVFRGITTLQEVWRATKE